MRKIYNKETKVCAFCRNYNNGFAPDSLKIEGRLFASFDTSEKYPCTLNGIIREAWFKCPNFVSRF